MTSSHAANLEAELGRLSATSQQLTAENDRLKQLKTAHAHEMETIVTALQRATGAAQSSRDRSESDKRRRRSDGWKQSLHRERRAPRQASRPLLPRRCLSPSLILFAEPRTARTP